MKKIGYIIRKKHSKEGIGSDYFSIDVEDDKTVTEITARINAKHSSDLIYDMDSIKILTTTFLSKELIKKNPLNIAKFPSLFKFSELPRSLYFLVYPLFDPEVSQGLFIMFNQKF